MVLSTVLLISAFFFSHQKLKAYISNTAYQVVLYVILFCYNVHWNV